MVRAIRNPAISSTDAQNNEVDSSITERLQRPKPEFQNSDPATLLKFLELRNSSNSEMSPEQREAYLNSAAKLEASEILKVGQQFGNDDYASRFEAFSQKISGEDPQYENKLITEIFKQDPGAGESWLKPPLQEAVRQGKINEKQRSAIAEGFATAYNQNPELFKDYLKPPLGFNFRRYGRFPGKFVDNGLPEPLKYVELMKASSGPQATQFKKDYGQYLRDHYINNSEEDERTRFAAAGMKLYLIGEKLDLSKSSNQDGISRILSAYANSKNPQTEEFIPDLARIAAENPELFKSYNMNGNYIDHTEHRQALGELMNKKSQSILDHYTNYNENIVTSRQGIPLSQMETHAQGLATLFNLSLFENSQQGQDLRKTVLNYSSDLKTRINHAVKRTNSKGYLQPLNQLAMLRAATVAAIHQNYDSLQEDHAQQMEVIGFAVDVSLDLTLKKVPFAGPVGSRLGKGAKELVSQSLYKDSLIKNALVKIKEDQLFDAKTGSLKAEARSQIMAELGTQLGEVIEKTELQNIFKSALLDGIEDESTLKQVQHESRNIIIKYQ